MPFRDLIARFTAKPAAAARPPAAGLDAHLVTRLAALVGPSALPCVDLDLDDSVQPGPTDSYLAGHPYLPPGADWPHGPAGPQSFVGQVHFAQIPPLDGFPRSGLLQWFVEADDSYGLTFDATAGQAGFTVRWFADPSAPSVASPGDPVPANPGLFPMEIEGPTALVFRPGRSLPLWDDLPEDVRLDPVWAEVAAAFPGDEPSDVYDERVRSEPDVLPDIVVGSKLGGHAMFTQEDPHWGPLLVELDANQTGGWGDVGIAHLFGDPDAVARGDLSSVRYHWDCT